MKQGLVMVALIGLAACQTAPAPNTKPAAAPHLMAKNAEIPFANHGGIDDWRADGTGAILIRAIDHKVYRATFLVPCHNLPFTERVGFVTDGRDTLDKFDSIVTGGEECTFDSFTEIPPPPHW